jgi:hypothetical protein
MVELGPSAFQYSLRADGWVLVAWNATSRSPDRIPLPPQRQLGRLALTLKAPGVVVLTIRQAL